MKFRKIFYNIKTWGLLKGFYFYLMIALRPCLIVCQIHVRPQSPNPKKIDLMEGVVIRLTNAEELISHCQDSILDLNESMIKSAYTRGDICVVALYKGQIVAYVWRAFNNTPHLDGLWVNVKEGYRYGYRAYTRPDFRHKGLQSAVSFYTDKVFYERGIDYGIGFIESHNYNSILSHQSRGSTSVGYAGY